MFCAKVLFCTVFSFHSHNGMTEYSNRHLLVIGLISRNRPKALHGNRQKKVPKDFLPRD